MLQTECLTLPILELPSLAFGEVDQSSKETKSFCTIGHVIMIIHHGKENSKTFFFSKVFHDFSFPLTSPTCLSQNVVFFVFFLSHRSITAQSNKLLKYLQRKIYGVQLLRSTWVCFGLLSGSTYGLWFQGIPGEHLFHHRLWYSWSYRALAGPYEANWKLEIKARPHSSTAPLLIVEKVNVWKSLTSCWFWA